MRTKTLLVLLAMLALPGAVQAQAPAQVDTPDAVADSAAVILADTAAAPVGSGMLISPAITPPAGIVVSDMENDAGNHLIVEFEPSPDEGLGIDIYNADSTSEWAIVEIVLPGAQTYIIDGYNTDQFPVTPGVQYEYMVSAVMPDETEYLGEPVMAQAVARGEWYHTGKTKVLIGCVVFIGLIFLYFRRALMGHQLYLRPIPGIDAIDEAIGRATEMGKPILYVPGLSSIEDVATIASLTILGRVAKKVAEYQTPLLVPNRDPIVYTVAEEAVKQAYLEAGRPDAYEENSVFFVTDSQFAYVAAVNGLMMREKPATNFYLGMFWAESLLLAETGSLSGAIQIAGTDAITQLPFFITTCDYTLIGEELYAASAYLGREPKQVGAVKGQDACKGIVMAFITIGILLSITDLILGYSDPSKSLLMKLQGLVDVVGLE
jgi:hypothetical protein